MFPDLSDPIVLLSLIIFLPAFGALLLCFIPKGRDELVKLLSLFVTVAVFLVTVWMAIPGAGDADSVRFALETSGMQNLVSFPWIPSFGINYMLGIDGISFPLIVLTAFLSVLAMWASWPITKQVKAYCILFLLLETGMLGVFMALDFFLFYVFWEVMLLPMYFLIGVWGGPRREYAAIKFFLFTLAGSVLMLIAILILYFSSDLNDLARLPAEELAACGIQQQDIVANEVAPNRTIRPIHTFNMLALAKIGQMDDSPFGALLLWGRSIGWWAFLLLFIGFVIKLPAVPVHTWLPDAHVEAPTPISMILAGVLLKMGGYGVLRVCYPMCPAAGYDLAWLVCGIGLLSMIYGAFAAMAQKDFKRLVAYSSVSHMGYVLLGIGVWSAAAGNQYMADYWKMGVNGAMFQMIAHGISSAGMFFLVGVVYERVHHRDLDKFGGLFDKMPVYTGVSIAIFFAAMGLPGLCGFWGELYVVLATWKYSMILAVLAAGVVILTAGYILWTVQRVYLGPRYNGPHGEALKPITRRELAIATPLVAMAVLLGVYPTALLDYMTPTVDAQVETLAGWTQRADQIEQAQLDQAQLEQARIEQSQPDQKAVEVSPQSQPGDVSAPVSNRSVSTTHATDGLSSPPKLTTIH